MLESFMKSSLYKQQPKLYGTWKCTCFCTADTEEHIHLCWPGPVWTLSLGWPCTNRDRDGWYILLQGLHRQVNPVLTSNMLVISIMFILDTLERWIWTMFIKLLPEAFKWNPIFDVHCRMPSDLSPLNPGEGILSCLSYVQITLTFLPNKIIMLLEYRDHILQISNSP